MKPTTRYKVTMEFVLFESNFQKCQYIYPTGNRDDQFQSCRKRYGRSLMVLQPHALFHFLIRIKPTSTNVLLQVAKYVEVTRRKIWAVRRMLKCFISQISDAYRSPDWQYGDGRYHAKGSFRATASQGFFFFTLSCVPAPSATKKRTTPHCSSLLAPQNAGLTHFTPRLPPEQ